MTWRIWWILTRAVESLENLHFDGLLLSKVCNVWTKKYIGAVLWKMTYGFKNDLRNLVNE